MEAEARAMLRDEVIEAIERIEIYTRDMSETSFDADPKTRDATYYNLHIVGKAASHIPDDVVSKYPEVPWMEIRGMGNLIVHEYYAVKSSIVWKTVTEDLPPLKAILGGILEKNSEGSS